MDEYVRQVLTEVARRHGTPSFVYLADTIRKRVRELHSVFAERFEIRYAVKANPNSALLTLLRDLGVDLDVSSAGEMLRGLNVGFKENRIGFTGPGKRHFELQLAIQRGICEIICESPDEIEEANRIASHYGVVQPILLRVNPINVPRKFGLQMGGQASQFGIDEEELPGVLSCLSSWSSVRFCGFHAFSAGNSLSEDAIVENLSNLIKLFTRFASDFSLTPQRFAFGSGFGIPYFSGDHELDLAKIGRELNPIVDEIRSQKRFCNTSITLEMGRWLVGTAGYMLTSVVRSKNSRGKAIRICDAGFNNNLSAAGMLGTVLRRDWQFWNLSAAESQTRESYMIVGPLCASFDVLGTDVALPPTGKGDVLAIGSSGAYGLSASPVGFISHPFPREILVENNNGETLIHEVTEFDKTHYKFLDAEQN
ncbi:MAG TPA: decarboxylase [Nitrosomonas nitrosa]|nr:decarboxylase [Nitrosomonas nitrosa]HNP52184.1 hypothetical protein [Nitrosomonas nitrosa]